METINALLAKIIIAINISSDVEKIILFGSRARGDADDRSDIDISVICPNISKRAWLKIFDNIDELDTILKIDIVRFDTASEGLRERILKEGKILYERNKT